MASSRRPGSATRPGSRTVPRSELFTRIIGLVLAGLFGVPFLLLVWVALSSRFGAASADPHGFALLFGTVLALALGLLLAIAVPLMLPAPRRGSAYLWTMVGYLVVAGVLVVSLLTA